MRATLEYAMWLAAVRGEYVDFDDSGYSGWPEDEEEEELFERHEEEETRERDLVTPRDWVLYVYTKRFKLEPQDRVMLCERAIKAIGEKDAACVENIKKVMDESLQMINKPRARKKIDFKKVFSRPFVESSNNDPIFGKLLPPGGQAALSSSDDFESKKSLVPFVIRESMMFEDSSNPPTSSTSCHSSPQLSSEINTSSLSRTCDPRNDSSCELSNNKNISQGGDSENAKHKIETLMAKPTATSANPSDGAEPHKHRLVPPLCVAKQKKAEEHSQSAPTYSEGGQPLGNKAGGVNRPKGVEMADTENLEFHESSSISWWGGPDEKKPGNRSSSTESVEARSLKLLLGPGGWKPIDDSREDTNSKQSLPKAPVPPDWKAVSSSLIGAPVELEEMDGKVGSAQSARGALTMSGGVYAKVPSVSARSSSAAWSESSSPNFVGVSGQKYFMLQCIGKGGFGTTYSVFDSSRRVFALKVTKCACVQDEKKNKCDTVVRDRLLDEGRMMMRLSGFGSYKPYYKGVVDTYSCEFDPSSNQVKTLMEKGHCDGNLIVKWMNKYFFRGEIMEFPFRLVSYLTVLDAFSFSAFRVIMSQMILAVYSVHSSRVIHLDIKPANFVFCANNEMIRDSESITPFLKLIDFGIAQEMNEDSPNVVKKDLIGTLNYMAPELLKGLTQKKSDAETIGTAADVWSLGVIAYQIVFKTIPFCSGSKLLEKIKEVTSDAKIQIPKIIPHDESRTAKAEAELLRDLLGRMLEKDASKRITLPQAMQHPFMRADIDEYIERKKVEAAEKERERIVSLLRANGVAESVIKLL